ncbi:ATP-binding protein [Actinokineospora globicatena]|uniref:ATP-binding protein n=2 Tax=Actinokineospora globicatena TaxID=103729 RepID=A0A9W6QRK6_9PSEU|nr:NACHT domain-containing protein [Actinokineospora globicatena]GLW95273.1 ATP-binding protein [Actinokineospora globicatena]
MHRRKATRAIEAIGDQVADQLAPTLTRRFGHLPAEAVEAAVLAVVAAVDDVDLTDKTFVVTDADPEKLARTIRDQFPNRPPDQVYDFAADQASRYLIHILRHLPPFQPGALSAALGQLTSLPDALEPLLSRIPATSLHASADTEAAFEAQYLSTLVRNLDRLELMGLPGEEVPVLGLSMAYLSLTVSQSGRYRVPVETAIGKRTKILLRGDAGSGKTTLVHWLAVRAAQHELGGDLEDWNGLVPFLIRLRAHATGTLPGPEGFAHDAAGQVAGLMPVGWAHRQLAQGRAMLLIDGVDEVPQDRRRAVKTWLFNVLLSYPGTRVVVTARTAAADQHWLADFTTVTLEPMDRDSVHEFVRRWHKAAGGRHDKAELRLRDQLERDDLRELAGTPLLCAMLCALNLTRKSELPRNRMDLYRTALAMLLHLRDAERGIASKLSDAESRVLLRDLAWRLTLANRVEIPRDHAIEHVARKLASMPNTSGVPVDLLTYLAERSGVLRLPAPDRVNFIHRTFQEYLAADEAIQQHHGDTLVGHAHLDIWWETITMACGHATAKQADQLINGILDRAEADHSLARHLRSLAVACLMTVEEINPGTQERMDAVIAQHLIPPRNIFESRSLARIGSRLLSILPGELAGLTDEEAHAVVHLAANVRSADSIPLLARYARDPRRVIQAELIMSWSSFDLARYASGVLADANLPRGQVVLHVEEHLDHLGALKHLHDVVFAGWRSGKTDRDRRTTVEAVRSLTLLVGEDFHFGAIPEIFPAVSKLCLHAAAGVDLEGARRLPLAVVEILGGTSVDLSPLAELPDLARVEVLRVGEVLGLEALGPLVEVVRV